MHFLWSQQFKKICVLKFLLKYSLTILPQNILIPAFKWKLINYCYLVHDQGQTFSSKILSKRGSIFRKNNWNNGAIKPALQSWSLDPHTNTNIVMPCGIKMFMYMCMYENSNRKIYSTTFDDMKHDWWVRFIDAPILKVIIYSWNTSQGWKNTCWLLKSDGFINWLPLKRIKTKEYGSTTYLQQKGIFGRKNIWVYKYFNEISPLIRRC